MFRLFIISILIISSAYTWAQNVRHIRQSISFNRSYRLEVEDSVSFKSCEDIINDKSIFISCEQGELVPLKEAVKLSDQSKLISLQLYKDIQLNEFKGFVLSHLKQKEKELSVAKSCFEKDSSCHSLILKMKKGIKNEMPKLREYMAFKDRALPLSSMSLEKTTPYRKKPQHDLGVLINRNIPYVSQSEDAKFRKIYKDKITEIKKDISIGLLSKGACFDKEKVECQSDISKRAIQASNIFNTNVRPEYEKKYLDLVTKNPLLLYLKITGEESDDVLISELNRAFLKIHSALSKSISRIEQMNGDDLLSLMNYESLVETYLKNHPQRELNCLGFKRFKQENKNDKLIEDIAIGVAVFGAGVICGSTAGTVCAIGSFFGAEALGLMYLEDQYDQKMTELNAGLVNATEVQEILDEEKMNILLAPTSILPIAEATKLVKDSKISQSIVNQFDSASRLLKEKLGELELKKALSLIRLATERDLNLELPVDRKVENKIEGAIRRQESDYSYFVKTNQQLPPPQTKLNHHDFYDPKPYVSESGSYNYDINHFRSAKSKEMTNIITSIKKGNFSDEELSLMTKEIEDIVVNPQQGFSASYIVTFKDGTKAIFKPSSELWTSNTRAEVVAYQVDDFFEFGIVPTTVERAIGGKRGSLQVIEEYAHKGIECGIDKNVKKTELSKQSFFDFLIDSRDRADNYLVRSDGSIITIDNGLSFTGRGTIGYGDSFQMFMRIAGFIRTDEGQKIIKRMRENYNDDFKEIMTERIGKEDAERFMERMRYLLEYNDRLMR